MRQGTTIDIDPISRDISILGIFTYDAPHVSKGHNDSNSAIWLTWSIANSCIKRRPNDGNVEERFRGCQALYMLVEF